MKDTRRGFLTKAGSLAAVSLAGCIGDDSGDDLPIAEGGRIPEEKRDLFGPNDIFAPSHVEWMIDVEDVSSTLGDNFDYEVERHELNTEASHYDDFQTVTISGISESDWKQILRDDLTEERRPRGPNTGSSGSTLERFIEDRHTSTDEILAYIDQAFEEGENFYNDPDNTGLWDSEVDLAPGEVFDIPEWAETVFMGLFEGITAEASIRGDSETLMGSGATTELTYTLFRKYAEEELDKEFFEDFHIWRFGTEPQKNDDWLLNHSVIGFAYNDGGNWDFKIVEPVPANEGNYTDIITENVADPEETPYFNSDTNQASAYNPNKALELSSEGLLSINEDRKVHNKLLEDIRGISDSAKTYEDSTIADAPEYAVWFSEEFRNSVEDTFTGNFSEEDLMNAVYTSRGLIEIQNELGYDRPLKIEGDISNPVVSYAPEEKIKRLINEE